MWLPPLNSHPNFYTMVSVKQPYIRRNDNPPILEPEPIFSIAINVMVKFYSDKSTEKRSLIGLSLNRVYRIPCREITRLSCKRGKRKLLAMVADMRIGFEVKNIFMSRQHHDENRDINWEDADVDTVVQKIWDFMHSMRWKTCNRGHNHLPIYLEIQKTVLVPDPQFRAWNSWYREKKMADPGFERNYMNVIRRPRTMEELFEQYMDAPKAASESAIEALEVAMIGDSSSAADTDCLVCLEKLQVGSKASLLPCFHVFHKECVVKWLQQSHMCPLCRFQLPSSKDRA